MSSEDLFYHATRLCPWFYLEGGPSSRRASPWSDGSDRDSDESGPTRARGIHHPLDTSEKYGWSFLLPLFTTCITYHFSYW
jgi:hypothetical protein